MSPEPAGDSPYLHHADYWIAAAEATEYPVRQGDLFANVQTADGAHLDAALVVHPTCELGKPSVTNVQVARVHPLDALSDEHQRQQLSRVSRRGTVAYASRSRIRISSLQLWAAH